MTTLITFEIIGAAPKGDGFQRVVTTGPSEAEFVKKGNYVKISILQKDVIFTNKAKLPVPLPFEVVGLLTVQNQYGYLNYNVSRAAFDLVGQRYDMYLQVVSN